MPDRLFGKDPFGEYRRCPICGEYGFANRHECDPVFLCRCEDYDEEEAIEIHATAAERAAEDYVAKHHSDWDYPTQVTVIVINPRDNCESKIQVDVEMVPSFSGTIIEER